MTDAPDWARGYDLDYLKSRAAFFRAHHERFVHGAFGLTKERDIAAALAAGEFHEVLNKAGEPSAAAIGKTLKSSGAQQDYTGRRISIPKQNTYVSTFATTDAAAAAFLFGEMWPPPSTKLWVEIFEEDLSTRTALEECGLTYNYTKVTAASEVKGVYHLGPQKVTPLSPLERAGLILVQDQFAPPRVVVQIIAEMQRARQAWAQHYSSYNKRHSWTSFALRGYDPNDPGFIIKPAEMSKGWQAENPHRANARCADTIALAHFPTVLELLESIPAKFERVRFMRLSAGDGELSRHADITDRAAGLRDGYIARLHVPIITNDKVLYSSWSDRGVKEGRRFPAGSLFYLDTRKPHAVKNTGDVDRIHLVVDAVSNRALRDWMTKRSFV